MIEKIIRNKITSYMTTNNLICKNQYGFVKKRSTTLQLLGLVEAWTKALDDGYEINTIYMDFQKAFDKVPHKKLLHKIKYYNICDTLVSCIQSFLTDRKQKVVVNRASSGWKEVTSGIPQGSVLGPLLFAIYISDLPNNINSEILLFADNTKLYRVIKTPEDRTLLQEDLLQLQSWSDKWLLKFHPDKCKVLAINKNNDYLLDYYLLPNNEKHTLSRTVNEKDIGVTFDEKITFENHIHAKVMTANKMMGLIRRSYKFLDQNNFIPLYKSLVRTHLDYAASVWSPSQQHLIDELEQVQRRATKLLPGLNKLSYEQRLTKLNLPTLSYRRIRSDMIEIYKIITGIYDESVSANIGLKLRKDNLRGHQYKLKKIRAKKSIRLNSFSHRVINLWNGLPGEVVSACNINTFKSRLDKHWINQDIITNYKAKILP